MSTNDDSVSSATQGASFLVRVWQERRREAGAEPVLRVYVRNLRTGEEQYLGDLDQLAEPIRRHLASQHGAAQRAEEPAGGRSRRIG